MYLIPTGLILVFAYINLQVGGRTVDLLPDALGYLLIAVDLFRLRQGSRAFRAGVPLCGVLAVYSAAVRALLPTGLPGLFLSLAELLAQLVLLYLLVSGVQDLEERVGVHLNGAVLERWRFWLSLCWLGSFVFVLVSQVMPTLAVLGLLLAAAWFALCALFIVVFYRTAHRYSLVLQRQGRG